MIEINESSEIRKKLKLEGKTEYLNKPGDIKAIIDFNKRMEKVHHDFIYKNAMSELHAREVILDGYK